MDYSYDRSRHFEIPRFFYFEVGNGTVGSRNTFNYQLLPKEVGEGDDKKKFSAQRSGTAKTAPKKAKPSPSVILNTPRTAISR